MQYILSEEEYRTLVDAGKRAKADVVGKLLSACRALANGVAWTENACPGCVLDDSGGYCSGCPSEEWCPYEGKRWPK